MKIDLEDPRVHQAIKLVKETHNVPFGRGLEKIFEEQYHCKIVMEDDPWCIRGHLLISEEKYQTWFILKFGDK